MANEKGQTLQEISKALDLEADQIRRVNIDIEQKHKSTTYLRMQPLEIEQN